MSITTLYPSKLSLLYLVANIKLFHGIAFFDDLSNKFVPADETGRALEVTAVEVQVATTESG